MNIQVKYLKYMILLLFIISCNKDNTVSPDSGISSDDLMGTWYNFYTNEVIGLYVPVFFDFTQDSAKTGIVNEDDNVELFAFDYSINRSKLIIKPPVIDTVNHSALQLFFVANMSGYLNCKNVCLVNDSLCFSNGKEIFKFSRIIPMVSGGKISGTVSVDGDLAKGMLMVAAVDPETMDAKMMLSNKTGTFTLPGLNDGGYWLMGIYIPQNHALCFWEYGLGKYCRELQDTLISINDGNTVKDRYLNIEIKDIDPDSSSNVDSLETSS